MTLTQVKKLCSDKGYVEVDSGYFSRRINMVKDKMHVAIFRDGEVVDCVRFYQTTDHPAPFQVEISEVQNGKGGVVAAILELVL